MREPDDQPPGTLLGGAPVAGGEATALPGLGRAASAGAAPVATAIGGASNADASIDDLAGPALHLDDGPRPVALTPAGARRALLVGVQKTLDPRIPERPGTCAAVRRIGGRLASGGWDVVLLLDDEPADDHRPWRSNLLDRLAWLRGGAEALLLVSGPVREGWFCPRDARLDRLDSTAIDLRALAAELPAGAGVLVDAPAAASAFDGVAWAVGAGPEGRPEALAGPRGPTPFLRAVVRAMSGEDRDVLTVDSLAGFIDRENGAGPWHRGAGARPLLTGLDAHRRSCASCGAEVSASLASFCPGCGAPLAAVELLDGGRYRLVERIGAGGMGQVFLAEDTRLKVRRALKLLSLPAGLGPADRETLRARMIQEARAAQALCAETHHVVQVYDVGFSPERSEPFLVMELLAGETLSTRLGRGPLSLDAALAIGRQIARTLAVAHARGFVHRDLKPDNVMLVERDGRDDFVKLLDFGLVKADQAEVSTETGRMMGTLQYMPPEQLRGLKVDARADVFSLGAVLFECIAGTRANPGATQQEIFGVLLERGVRSLGEVAPHAPAPLVRLVDACLKLIPEQRPKDAGAVADALDALELGAAGAEVAPFATAETLLPSDVDAIAPRAPTLRGPPRATLGTTRTAPPVSAPPRHPRRWLLLLPALVVALGWGCGGRPTPSRRRPRLTRRRRRSPPRRPWRRRRRLPPDAGPTPLPRPEGPLVAQPDATRRLDGDAVVYQAAAPADAFAALVIDLTIAGSPPPEPDITAAERWAAAPEAVRDWLAAGVDVAGLALDGDRLRVPLDRITAARERRPAAHALRQIGALLAREDGAVFETVNCGRLAPGDRLLTARWKMRGYPGGACEAGVCPAALVRALQQAQAAGERLQVSLTLARRTKDGDVASDHVSAVCHVRP
ncbi:MAG: protein kinase [Myxococcales bacterium]|nr:protein kinase [Myxococcales bacterium]